MAAVRSAPHSHAQGAMNIGENYRHSGTFTVSGLLIGAAVGSLTGWLLAWPYAYFVLYVPLVGVFTVLIAGGFGMLAGLAAAVTLRSRKVRSAPAAAVIGLIVGLSALYDGWAVWLHAVIARAGENTSSVAIMLSPAGMWLLMQKINEVGIFTLRGLHPTGAALWGMWGAEAAIIVGGAAWATYAFNTQDPFCEHCNVWAD